MVVFIGKRREGGSEGLKTPSQEKQIIAKLRVWTRDHSPLGRGSLLRRRGVKNTGQSLKTIMHNVCTL